MEQCVALLSELIAYRTVNPGGDELALCNRLADELRARHADDVAVASVPRTDREFGGYVFARYGTPRLVINVHLDTVPVNNGWHSDPFVAQVKDGRLYGLGSADIKGAIAAVLVALTAIKPRDVGILFSGDEENGARCVQAFTSSAHMQGIERVIVCEPTRRCAGMAHRGIRAYRAHAPGQGGHSSQADHKPKPLVTMARLALSMDELGVQYRDQGPADMRGLCMNVGRIDGGIAANVIPNEGWLEWSIRPPPGFDAAAFDGEIQRRISALGEGVRLDYAQGQKPFATRDVDSFRHLIGDFANEFTTLDFWTEAALWSEAGADAVVIGPGDIANAHAPNEFVTLDDLNWAMDLFTHVLSANGA